MAAQPARLDITSEPVDDLPILLKWLKDMHVAEIVDKVLPAPHGNRSGLSYGQLAVGYLAFILSESDHRLSYVQEWMQRRQRVFAWQWQQPVGPKEFTDDRLEDMLRQCGNPTARAWEGVDEHLGHHLIAAYALPTEAGRLDTTSVSVYHHPSDPETSLLQWGYSKDHRPDLRQFVQQLGTLDPVGVPLVTATLPGNTADDHLYLPAWRRMVQVIGHAHWLLVCDSKFSNLANQAQVHAGAGRYLAPLPLTGEWPTQLTNWVLKPPTAPRWLKVSGLPARTCRGFEVTVPRHWINPEPAAEAPTTVDWEQRVLVIWRKSFADKQRHTLHARLARAEADLHALQATPHAKAEELPAKIQAVLERHAVTDLLSATPHWSVTQEQKFVGPGRAGPNRPTRTIEHHQLRLDIRRRPTAIEAAEALLGWRLYATNAPEADLSLEQAVAYYGGQWQPEHGFHRLKGRPLGVAPVYLRDDDCLRGLMVIMGIALRVLTLTEFVVRRQLATAADKPLAGLYEGNPRRTTLTPTTERILKAFVGVMLYCYRLDGEVHYQVTDLSPLQKRLLKLMQFPANLYNAPSTIPSG